MRATRSAAFTENPRISRLLRVDKAANFSPKPQAQPSKTFAGADASPGPDICHCIAPSILRVRLMVSCLCVALAVRSALEFNLPLLPLRVVLLRVSHSSQRTLFAVLAENCCSHCRCCCKSSCIFHFFGSSAYCESTCIIWDLTA